MVAIDFFFCIDLFLPGIEIFGKGSPGEHPYLGRKDEIEGTGIRYLFAIRFYSADWRVLVNDAILFTLLAVFIDRAEIRPHDQRYHLFECCNDKRLHRYHTLPRALTPLSVRPHLL